MADATCAGCGCLCDDIVVTEGRPARTCSLGDRWFAERGGERPPVARVDGTTATLDGAVAAAAAILREARAPLVYGLGQTSCEAQRRAVALAEAAGAVVDPAGGGAGILATQTIGASTATFGEIRDRDGIVVVWRADPATTHPRLLSRLRLDRAARGSRGLVVVDAQRTATADEADAFVELDAAHDFEALSALRALVGNAPLERERVEAPLLDDLAGRLLGAHHVALIHGALDELGALALTALVRDLSRDRHAVTLGLRATATRAAPRMSSPGRRGSPPRSASPAATRARARAPPRCSSAARSTRPSSSPPTPSRTCRACASCRSSSSTREPRRPRRRRGSPSPPRPTASRCPAPPIAWTACRSRCARP